MSSVVAQLQQLSLGGRQAARSFQGARPAAPFTAALPAVRGPPRRVALKVQAARVGGVEIPNQKHVEFSLQYIYGIGPTTAKAILVDTGIENKRTRELTEEELTRLREEVDKYTTEGDLRRFNAMAIRRLKEIGCYRGRRHINGKAKSIAGKKVARNNMQLCCSALALSPAPAVRSRQAAALGARRAGTPPRTRRGHVRVRSQGLDEEGRAWTTMDAEHRFDDLFNLSGSTALVTGGAQGIGAAIAVDIANEDNMAKVVKKIEEVGQRAVAVKMDVRRRSLVKVAMEEAVEAMGVGPDILVASAGVIGRLERADSVSHDGWTEVMAVNLEGSYNAAQACYEHMKKAGRGKVVFISSIAGTRSAGMQAAYASSKGALLTLGRSLAAAWGRDNIQVEYILSRIPLGKQHYSRRLGLAGDMVGPALFLVSHASDYITGAEIAVDGGGAILPMLANQNPDSYLPSYNSE
eukprot:scaffold2.g6831.t1